MKKLTRLKRFSFLLRGWQATQPSGRDPPVWHFSLEDPYSGRRRGFASFDELLLFLESFLANDGSVPNDDLTEAANSNE